MCGIAGFRTFAAPHDGLEEGLARASERMVRRGPDGSGTWISEDRTVGFAHRRLAIIDLSPGGAQPMREEAAGLVITYNGEIYNYRELREELEAKGHRFRTGSDTEVLLKMYAEHGSDMCRHLVGMFALGIYREHDRSVFLARGPVGIKPLYYAWEGETLWFASQVKALVAAGVDAAHDPAGVTGFLLWGNVPSGMTIYKKIREVAPGTSMLVRADGSTHTTRYFDFVEQLQLRAEEVSNLSVEDAAESFREEVRATVKRHFVADVPVSVFLSAGKDSATLLALASEVLPEPPSAVTLGFKEYHGTEWDEVPVAQEVAAAYGCPHHVVEVGADDFLLERDNILDAMDQPSVDGVNTYFVSQAARKVGFKVALSGLGADEVLGGYSSFESVPKLVRASGIAASVPGFGVAIREVARRVIRERTSPKYASLLEYGGSVGGAYLLRRAMFMPWEIKKLLPRGFAEKGLETLGEPGASDRLVEPLKGRFTEIVALETMKYMVPRLLRDSDWASMYHSLELRVPFVDTPFLRLVMKRLQLDERYLKSDLLTVPARPLPASVTNRPKTGFMVPVTSWLLGDAAGSDKSLRGWAAKVLASQTGIEIESLRPR